MPTNHIEKRIESPEVDCFLVLVTQMYLLSFLCKKSIKYLKVLKETIDFN